jgi:predicted lipid carrier protein YhbT
VVALRNAVDDAGLDLVAEAAALLGPLAPAAERAFHAAAGLARHVGIGTEAVGGAWN